MLAAPLYLTKRRSRAACWLRPARSPASRADHRPAALGEPPIWPRL